MNEKCLEQKYADLKVDALVEHLADVKVDCWVEPMAVHLVQ